MDRDAMSAFSPADDERGGPASPEDFDSPPCPECGTRDDTEFRLYVAGMIGVPEPEGEEYRSLKRDYHRRLACSCKHPSYPYE